MGEWIDKREHMPEKEDCDRRGRVLVWNEFSGADMMGLNTLKHLGGHVSHWMRIPGRPGMAPGWTPKSMRLPGMADADAQGCVMIWNDVSDAAFVTAVDNVRNYGTRISHWMKLPEGPAKQQG